MHDKLFPLECFSLINTYNRRRNYKVKPVQLHNHKRLKRNSLQETD